MKLKQYITIFIAVFLSSVAIAQNIENRIDQYFKENSKKLNFSIEDIRNWRLTSHYESAKGRFIHAYGIQQLNGLDIHKAVFGIHFSNAYEVRTFNESLISNLKSKSAGAATQPSISGKQAITFIARHLNMPVNNPITLIEKSSIRDLEQSYIATSLTSDIVHLNLKYFMVEDQLKLVWDVKFKQLNTSNLLNFKVDASSGEILNEVNLTSDVFHKSASNISTCNHDTHKNSEIILKDVINNEKSEAFQCLNNYQVFPYPIESPNFGIRASVPAPIDMDASPRGWHDTLDENAITPPPEFTITRGNNVFAYENYAYITSTPGISPDGGANLCFQFPINTAFTDANRSADAATTNLFYWINMAHDIFYHHGFDEVSGNFQENNYDHGGLGGDSVNAEAQVFINNNSPGGSYSPELGADGTNPIIRIRVTNDRDASYDNGVIIHEFGHGIVDRLIGGPNVNFDPAYAGNPYEGWCDWFALMLTMDIGNAQEDDDRSIGTWALGQDFDGPGARNVFYSTSNDLMFSDINDPIFGANGYYHDIGEIWGTMLWEITWALINTYGNNPDIKVNYQSIPNPTNIRVQDLQHIGGNNIALDLVIQSLRVITSIQPNFINARDAIIQADEDLYGGLNRCILWEAFAERGIGNGASMSVDIQGNITVQQSDNPEPPTLCTDCENITPVISNRGDIDPCSFQFEAINSGDFCPTEQINWSLLDDTNTELVNISDTYFFSIGTAVNNNNLPDFVPTQPGNYTLVLTISNNGNNEEFTNVPINIPVSCIDSNPPDPCNNIDATIGIDENECNYTFEAENIDTSCTSVQYSWSVTDPNNIETPNISNLQTFTVGTNTSNVNYITTQSGTYIIELTVSSPSGGSDTETYNLNIPATCFSTNPPDLCDDIIAQINPTISEDGCDYSFDSENIDTSCPNVTYQWALYFGDNTSMPIDTSNLQDYDPADTLFNLPGAYSVTLQITGTTSTNDVFFDDDIYNFTLEESCFNDPCDEDLNAGIINRNELTWTSTPQSSYELEFVADNRCSDASITDPGPEVSVSYTVSSVPFDLNTAYIALSEPLGMRYRIRLSGCDDWSYWCCITPTLQASPDIWVFTEPFAECFPADPCEDFLDPITLTSPNDDINAANGGNIDYINYTGIMASNNVEPNFTSNYRASNSIKLLPGFHAEQGSNFRAYIADCGVEIIPSLPKLTNNTNEDDKLLERELKIFPNPVSEELNIEITKNKLSEIVIQNIQGQVVYRSSLSGYKARVNMQNLPSGLYILSLSLDDNSVIHKQIIVK